MDDSQPNTESLEFQYVSGQNRSSFPALIASFEKESAAFCKEAKGCELDVPYGDAALERYDFFYADKPAAAVLVFFHAGYWQSRDKSTFRFLAKAFTQRGMHTALVNYPLCPSVTVAQIIEFAEKALCKIRDHEIKGREAASMPFLLAGHSAGAQIALELALRLASRGSGLLQQIAGIMGISGVYDLEPLVATTLNRSLGLDVAEARRLSPLRKARYLNIPAIFLVGETETPAFLKQNEQMSRQWSNAGNPCEQMESSADDHFSVLRAVVSPSSAVLAACDKLILAYCNRPPGRNPAP